MEIHARGGAYRPRPGNSRLTTIEALEQRLYRLEAVEAIRGVITRYMALCDHLDANTKLDELGALFTEDAVWCGTGARYGAAFGSRHGRTEIVNMLAAYCCSPPHFALNAHFLTSETIDVEGEAAQGTWMMLQTSTYADGRSDLRSARLHVGFARHDARWRIARFSTENIFARSISAWDDGVAVPTPHRPGG